MATLIVVLLTAAVLSLELIVAELIAAAGHMWLGLFSNIGWRIFWHNAAAAQMGRLRPGFVSSAGLRRTCNFHGEYLSSLSLPVSNAEVLTTVDVPVYTGVSED